MSIKREPIHAALFGILQTIPGLKTCSRRLRHFDDVSPADCPALFMVQKSQTTRTQTRVPTIWELDVELVLYVKTDGSHDSTPATALNDVLDAIEAALEPTNRIDPRQTLGGLVYDCKINGAIDTDEGTMGEMAGAIIPIRLVIPAIDTTAFPLS